MEARKGKALAVVLSLFFGVASSTACATHRTAPADLEVEGLRNLDRIDEGLYRSAQPTARGFEEAHRLGIRTVLNLRSHGDAPGLAGSGLASVRVPMRQWHADEERIAAALRVMSDPALRPVLVHCQEGCDRTGVVVAAYRVVVDGVSREEAVADMRAHGNHPLWANLRRWVLTFDVERMRRLMATTPLPEVERP